MNELQIFENEEFGQIRTSKDEKGNILFCGIDVAKALGYAKPRNAINTHCKGALKQGTLTNGGVQELLFIYEPDFYRLIAKSKLPSAEKFEKWVFETVLPSIRKYGAYITHDKLLDIIENPDSLEFLLQRLLIETQKKKKLQQEIEMLRPKAKYFDQLMDGNLLVNFRTTAKEIGIKPMFFISFLLARKYLYRDAKQVLNPYQLHLDNELFKMREYKKYGHFGTQTLVTTKGRDHFLDLFIKGEIPLNYFLEE